MTSISDLVKTWNKPSLRNIADLRNTAAESDYIGVNKTAAATATRVVEPLNRSAAAVEFRCTLLALAESELFSASLSI